MLRPALRVAHRRILAPRGDEGKCESFSFIALRIQKMGRADNLSGNLNRSTIQSGHCNFSDCHATW